MILPDSVYQAIGVVEGKKRLYCCDGHAFDVAVSAPSEH